MSFVTVHCAQCKEAFGLERETEATLRRSSAGFFCPWGHPLVFSQEPNEAETLRRERDRLKQQIAEAEQDRRIEQRRRIEAEHHAAAAERRVGVAKGQITKLRKRAQAGVCPCCNRQFAVLAKHMQAKHPSFAAAPVILSTDAPQA